MRQLISALLFAVGLLQLAGCSAAPPTQTSGLVSPQANRVTAASSSPSPTPLPPAASAATDGASAVVKTLRANLRESPTGSGAVVREVAQGDALVLVGPAPLGPWYKVQHRPSGAVGWIHGNAIDVAKAGRSDDDAAVTADRAKERVEPPAQGRAAAPAPSSGRSYVNVDGERVPSPVFADSAPAGASAQCRDGSYSFSRNRRGTCSHHGGVARWL